MSRLALRFLGTGSAFNIHSGHSNMFLQAANGERLFIDVGAWWALFAAKQGIGYRDVNYLYITHLHPDHVGGLADLALAARFAGHPYKPVLYIHESLVDGLWQCLQPQLCFVSVRDWGIRPGEMRLDHYFQVEKLPKGFAFSWYEFSLRSTPVVHILTAGGPMYSHALFGETPGGKKFFISSDMIFQPRHIGWAYEAATIIFHDCETIQGGASGVHSHYTELLTLPEYIRARMWLYHYNSPHNLPNAQTDGFCGFVEAGTEYKL